MTPTKFLLGQMIRGVCRCGGRRRVVCDRMGSLGILAFQRSWAHPGSRSSLSPFYFPWRLFEWWYAYDAYAPNLFNMAGAIAATSGFAGCGVAIVGSLWRARQNKNVTTYGSSRWAQSQRRSRRQACSGLRACFSASSWPLSSP